MSFIIGELLATVKSEDLTFWLFFGLLERYRLELVFSNGLSADLYLDLLRSLLELYLPNLTTHLQSLGISWNIIIKNFILSLGAIFFPLEFLSQVFDIFFIDGWIGLYKVAITLFSLYESKICNMNTEELNNFLKTLRKTITDKDMKTILRKILELDIKKDTIDQAITQFFIDHAKRYLSRDYRSTDWPSTHSHTLQQAADYIRQILGQHSSDMEVYKNKLSNIESFLSRAQGQYKKLEKEYVETKVDKEGMEEQKGVLESAKAILINDVHLKRRDSFISDNILKIKWIERLGFGSLRSSATLSNETEAEKDDVEVLNRKIKEADDLIKRYSDELKKRGMEIQICRGYISDHRERWDLLQSQSKELTDHTRKRIQTIYTKVGIEMRQKSSLTIEMLNLL